MAKLTRYLQKIFANNSNEVGVFGTGVDKETSKNVETLQSADYEEGWSSAIITNKNYPIWQEMDGVQYGLSYQIKYLEQAGIPEWLSTETYYTNCYCRYGSDIYYSLQDDNTNHSPLLNDGWWTLYGGANTNLSNLTTTGKNNLVICANELDWTNAITVSTTISTNEQTYTTTTDGVIFLMSTASGGSNSKFAYTYISTRSILKTPDDYGYCLSGTGSGYLATLNMFFKEGETITFKIYASGGNIETSVKAIFVPFKKA